MGALVAPGQLATYLQQHVQRDAEETAIRVAEGWLAGATPGLTEWPDPVPEQLWAWALELAAIAYGNPENLTQRSLGDYMQGWGAAGARRKEILAAAAQSYPAVTAAPVYCFPLAPTWPDPPNIPGGG